MTNDPQGRARLRVTHCPVNIAGIPWQNVQALRRKGVDARLVVFNRGHLHPEADWSLDRHGPLAARLVQQAAAFARLAPQTDIFHFYFGLTLIPKSIQFPLLRLLRKKSVFHYLGSDIRGKSPAELAFGKRADAEIVGSYDAIRWVPEAHVIPPGLDLRPFTPVPPSDNPRPLVVHAPSNREKKGTRYVIEACAQLPVDLDIVEGVPHEHRARALRPRRHRRRPAARRLARRVRARVDGARQARRHLPEARRRRPERRGLRDSAARRARDEGDARRGAPPARREPRSSAGRSAPRAAPTSSRCTTSTASPTACSTSTVRSDLSLAAQLKRLVRHSAIYGLGGIVSRLLAVILLPLYTRLPAARPPTARSRSSPPRPPCS